MPVQLSWIHQDRNPYAASTCLGSVPAPMCWPPHGLTFRPSAFYHDSASLLSSHICHHPGNHLLSVWYLSHFTQFKALLKYKSLFFSLSFIQCLGKSVQSNKESWWFCSVTYRTAISQWRIWAPKHRPGFISDVNEPERLKHFHSLI